MDGFNLGDVIEKDLGSVPASSHRGRRFFDHDGRTCVTEDAPGPQPGPVRLVCTGRLTIDGRECFLFSARPQDYRPALSRAMYHDNGRVSPAGRTVLGLRADDLAMSGMEAGIDAGFSPPGAGAPWAWRWIGTDDWEAPIHAAGRPMPPAGQEGLFPYAGYRGRHMEPYRKLGPDLPLILDGTLQRTRPGADRPREEPVRVVLHSCVPQDKLHFNIRAHVLDCVKARKKTGKKSGTTPESDLWSRLTGKEAADCSVFSRCPEPDAAAPVCPRCDWNTFREVDRDIMPFIEDYLEKIVSLFRRRRTNERKRITITSEHSTLAHRSPLRGTTVWATPAGRLKTVFAGTFFEKDDRRVMHMFPLTAYFTDTTTVTHAERFLVGTCIV